MSTILIKGGTVVTPGGAGSFDILISGETIRAVTEPGAEAPSDARVIGRHRKDSSAGRRRAPRAHRRTAPARALWRGAGVPSRHLGRHDDGAGTSPPKCRDTTCATP